MGMFSWKCKGCGGELCCPELVRINGNVGVYDGYGTAGKFDYAMWAPTTGERLPDPVAWHERCHREAEPAARNDMTASAHAPNQGFGEAQDRFMPHPDTPHPHAEFGWKLSDKFVARDFFEEPDPRLVLAEKSAGTGEDS